MTKSKNVSVYLADRALTAIRPGDSLSGRLNQMVDRYLEILHTDGPAVRAAFNAKEWARLVEAWSRASRGKPLAIAASVTLGREFPPDDPIVATVKGMPAGDFFIMLELLEADAPVSSPAKQETPATHS